MADGKSLKSFTTLLVAASMIFPILIILFVTHQNSISDILKEYNILVERANYTTTDKQKTQNAGPKNNAFEDVKDDDEKLLGGLLVSSFDKASCISRFQSYLYRKASPYKPSKYLISKLRNYENLHQRCGPYTKSYNETMKEGANFSKNSVDSKCKYFIWTIADGLGNRMLSMVSAFLYAILTDRVLLVRFQDEMLNLFCEPFPNSSWMLPNNSPFSNDLNQFKTFESMLANNKENNSQELLPSIIFITLMDYNSGNSHFHCDKNQDLLQKVPVLILRANQYFVPSLFIISSFRQDFNKMFPDKNTIFHHLGRYLFHPSNEVWERIQNVYKEHLVKVNERIGVQIRIYNTRDTPKETIINETISCLQQNKLLPKFNMSSPLEKNTSKLVLVVSLYSKYGEGLKSIYESNTSLSKEVIKVYQPSHEENQNSGDNMHNIKAWTDIYLLGLCDALVTSPGSTFGYVAHGLRGMKPLVLQSIDGKTIPDLPCQQLKHMEPCYHIPPKYDCGTNITSDDTFIFHNTKHCQDWLGGIKIINMYD